MTEKAIEWLTRNGDRSWFIAIKALSREPQSRCMAALTVSEVVSGPGVSKYGAREGTHERTTEQATSAARPASAQRRRGMMVRMTARSKIAVSLPSPLIDQAKAAVVQGRAPNVSAYVERALEERVKLDDLETLLQDLLAETGGPLTDDERG